MATALLVVTSLYAGFQWTIRVVVYPQFPAVPGAAFERFEARHQRLVAALAAVAAAIWYSR